MVCVCPTYFRPVLSDFLQQIASKLIADSVPRDGEGNVINPLDAQFRSLKLTSMVPIDRSTSEFATLNAYARNAHGVTNRLRTRIECAFRVDR